jgi:hypothetical protein
MNDARVDWKMWFDTAFCALCSALLMRELVLAQGADGIAPLGTVHCAALAVLLPATLASFAAARRHWSLRRR